MIDRLSDALRYIDPERTFWVAESCYGGTPLYACHEEARKSEKGRTMVSSSELKKAQTFSTREECEEWIKSSKDKYTPREIGVYCLVKPL